MPSGRFVIKTFKIKGKKSALLKLWADFKAQRVLRAKGKIFYDERNNWLFITVDSSFAEDTLKECVQDVNIKCNTILTVIWDS